MKGIRGADQGLQMSVRRTEAVLLGESGSCGQQKGSQGRENGIFSQVGVFVSL
jgi:hypothetical protein